MRLLTTLLLAAGALSGQTALKRPPKFADLLVAHGEQSHQLVMLVRKLRDMEAELRSLERELFVGEQPR